MLSINSKLLATILSIFFIDSSLSSPLLHLLIHSGIIFLDSTLRYVSFVFNFLFGSKIDNIFRFIIASSTSGLTMTKIQELCSTPERTVIGHPFNPPYLLPLVEIVGGKKSSASAAKWAFAFYKHVGKEPLAMKKEIPGFVATRLQEALWREALHMVAAGEATPEQIDSALINGPAPRMAVQGQCMAFHVACGAGGMATNLDQFGPALELPWTRLKAPKLTKDLRNKMVEGCDTMSEGKDFKDMARQRDKSIVAILKAIRTSQT